MSSAPLAVRLSAALRDAVLGALDAADAALNLPAQRNAAAAVAEADARASSRQEALNALPRPRPEP